MEANAQATNPDEAAATQDIVVTATKRSQNLSKIPAAITAIGSDMLTRKAVIAIRDINGTVPGLQIANANTDVSVTIRGVGHSIFSPSAENSVALHLDGVYLSRPSSAQGAFFDVSRVEVLRGPQGTLYGRNASGGAINIVSNDPTRDFSGYLSGTYGNYNRVDLEAVVSGPLAGDTLLGRIGGFYHRHDGFGTNLATGDPVDNLNEYGGKVAIVAQPSDRLKLTLRGDYFHADDRYGEFHFAGSVRQPVPGLQILPILLGGVPAANIRDTNYAQPSSRYADNSGITGLIDYDIGNGFSVKSTTAYRKTINRYSTNDSGTNLNILDPFVNDARARQFSQELQFNWKTENLFVLLGGYYFHEVIDSDFFIGGYLASGVPQVGIPPIFPAPFGVVRQVARGTTDAKAVFGNVDWDVTPRLHLGGGLRYSEETKGNRGYEIAFFPDFTDFPTTGYDTVDDSRKSSALTPKFTARFDLTPDVNVYASVSRGFKSGEWIAGTSQYAQPERLWAYEAGLKGAFFNRTLRASVGGFYYDYTNFQVQRVIGPISLIQNLPKATIYGAEVEATWRLPANFSLDGNLTYLHTRNGGFITQDPNVLGSPTVDLKGRRLAYAPTITLNLGVEKRFEFGADLEGTLRFDVQHTSETYLTILQSKGTDYRAPNTILNASYKQQITKRLSVLVWGKNLTDRTVILNTLTQNIPNLIVPTNPGPPPYASASALNVNLNDPRAYGLTVRFDW